MQQKKIERLTPEQEALYPTYLDKWRSIALKPGPIDRQKAKQAIKAAYSLFRLKEPKILFFDSPYAALNALLSQPGSQLGQQLEGQLWSELEDQLSEVESQLSQLWRQLKHQLESELRIPPYINWINPELWVCGGAWFDFYISILKGVHHPKKWKVFQVLVKYCGWIFFFEKIAIVCDRPIKLSFDNESRLHAEAKPALQFADGYSLYSYHGVTLPKKYGAVYPQQWQAKWLLEEWNAELRRVLIQEIGYARICQELQAKQIDSWREYTLLRINNQVEIEPIYLLKMTCPSTGSIHALRVPPSIQSAREAIRWVNWGTDPEEFAVQT